LHDLEEWQLVGSWQEAEFKSARTTASMMKCMAERMRKSGDKLVDVLNRLEKSIPRIELVGIWESLSTAAVLYSEKRKAKVWGNALVERVYMQLIYYRGLYEISVKRKGKHRHREILHENRRFHLICVNNFL
jgi:hypothetical protein